MSSAVRSALIFTILLLVVVVGSFVYMRTLESTVAPAARTGGGTEAPTQLELSAELQAAIEAIDAGRFDEAQSLLETIAPADPAYVLAIQKLGVVHWRRGELEQSRDQFRRLIRLQPENPEAWVQLAWADFRAGEYRAAEFSTLRALELQPDHVPARYNVALFRVALGETSSAIEAYQRARNLDLEQSYRLRAIEHLLQLEQVQPENAEVHYVLAYFANLNLASDTEVEELERYLALGTDGPTAELSRKRLAELQGVIDSP